MSIKPLTRLLFLQGGLCFFCKKPLSETEASVEHLVASANGGSNRDDNCVACCKSLNILLGSMPLKNKIDVCLNQKGQFVCPNGVQKKIAKTKPVAPPKTMKAVPDYYTQVVANLKQRGNSKPGTVEKLKSTIASLFQKKLSAPEIDAIVQQLQSNRVISIAGAKVTYV